MDSLSPQDPELSTQAITIKKKPSYIIAMVATIVVIVVTAFYHMLQPPKDFQKPTFFRVERGNSLTHIGQALFDAHMIRSPIALQFFFILSGDDKNIAEGDYYFEKPLSVFAIARRLATNNFNTTQIKITLPEGMTRSEMAAVLGKNFPLFLPDEFLEKTRNAEGYLFPDTYFLSPQSNADDIIARLTNTFAEKISPFISDIQNSKRSKGDIIIMASLIEKEAHGTDDRNVISGILWKRIDSGMKLQVDASVGYIANKLPGQISAKDLKIDSPYNTYLYAGLPPTPIDNPGIAAIDAAIHPVESPYFFYIHDKAGIIHYAKTFIEHKANIAKYLK